MKIKVKAAPGISVKCQGKRITDAEYVSVKPDHNVTSKLLDKSLIMYSIRVDKPVAPPPVKDKVSNKKAGNS